MRRKTTKTIANLKLLEAQYNELKPLADRFGSEIEHQLSLLLDERGIVLGLPIQTRTKAWTSIREKVERKSLTLDAIQDLWDLVGIRIIVQFLKDVDTTREIIRSHFKILEENDTEGRLREDQFGYTSIHFIVELPSEWLTVPTLSAMKGLRAEIQLRTTAQHIWAVASHTLQYKQEASIPVPIRRAIHRVSALLETVDLEFDRVLQEREAYRASLESNVNGADINVDVIEKLLDDTFPSENKEQGESYETLMDDGFYPVFTDGYKTLENSRSRLASRLRIRGL